MGINFKALQGSHPINDIPIAHQHNMEELLSKLQVLEKLWGKQFLVTSGYRSAQDHNRIYANINSKRKKEGLAPAPVPMSSKHLSGQAADIFDPDGALGNWLHNDVVGIANLDKLDLYCEQGTSTWVHFQIVPPKSGKRWFLP